ncbi:MAG TPA: pyridoxamine 5'-phosphate oxidase family protein [Spirochaetota bacterium]|nr:pyridoxamine 5'-phosphate oxidase family protein [Spirochaetota bacterium]HNT12781.1 pyridoxamine 5'-phosphate oxidase family protein [Spirochaetota bacterium]
MDLKEYFETRQGTGVLATADAQGNVDAALYSRPHVMDDGTVAFIMNDRVSHRNLQSNPRAAYLFTESENRRDGIRLYLVKSRETDDPAAIEPLRRHRSAGGDDGKKLFLVVFTVERTRPLVDAAPSG